MPDVFTKEQRHANMAAIRSSSTKPEVILRHALWNLGFRYRVNEKSLPGTPDIVLPRYKTVIFVHGCFWHGHKDCKNYTIPKTNTDFWTTKVAINQQRDQKVWRQLEAKGWSVSIVWECELKKARLKETVEAVAAGIRRNGDNLLSVRENRRKVNALYREERRLHRERESILATELKTRYPER